MDTPDSDATAWVPDPHALELIRLMVSRRSDTLSSQMRERRRENRRSERLEEH